MFTKKLEKYKKHKQKRKCEELLDKLDNASEITIYDWNVFVAKFTQIQREIVNEIE